MNQVTKHAPAARVQRFVSRRPEQKGVIVPENIPQRPKFHRQHVQFREPYL